MGINGLIDKDSDTTEEVPDTPTAVAAADDTGEATGETAASAEAGGDPPASAKPVVLRFPDRPTSAQLKEELEREKEKKRYSAALRNTIGVLIVVAAVSVLIAVFFVRVLRVRGDSMAPNLNEGEMVVAFQTKHFNPGDIVAFYYGPSILLKRVVGSPGDIIVIDDEGNVFVNGEQLNEYYLTEKDSGDYNDIEYPFQVPEKRYFVLGDNRKESIDSRSYEIGTVTAEQIVGKVLIRVWPLW